jgi:preprotein translocase subunit YajC
MVETLIALVVLGVVVALLFTFVWRADAKRAQQVENDEERLQTEEHES